MLWNLVTTEGEILEKVGTFIRGKSWLKPIWCPPCSAMWAGLAYIGFHLWRGGVGTTQLVDAMSIAGGEFLIVLGMSYLMRLYKKDKGL